MRDVYSDIFYCVKSLCISFDHVEAINSNQKFMCMYLPNRKNSTQNSAYQVVKYWPEKGKSGFLVWRYLMRRDDPTPAPWTKAGGKRVKELGLTMQVCFY